MEREGAMLEAVVVVVRLHGTPQSCPVIVCWEAA